MINQRLIKLCFYRQAEQLFSPSGTRTWRVPLRSIPVSRLLPEEHHPFLLWAWLPHQQQGPCLQVSAREMATSNTGLHPHERWEIRKILTHPHDYSHVRVWLYLVTGVRPQRIKNLLLVFAFIWCWWMIRHGAHHHGSSSRSCLFLT